MNIKPHYFADILVKPRKKPIEYHEVPDYWLRRLERVGPTPFNLRLLNGMTEALPEATFRKGGL